MMIRDLAPSPVLFPTFPSATLIIYHPAPVVCILTGWHLPHRFKFMRLLIAVPFNLLTTDSLREGLLYLYLYQLMLFCHADGLDGKQS